MENIDYVYDVEFYQNFFCVNFKKFPLGEEKKTFEISSRKDDRKELLSFLQTENLRLIGFNNVGYDYPVLHMIIQHPEISLLIWWKKIQQEVFNEKRGIVWENKRHIYQIDLFKINHYDNLARSSSLKWLEFTKRWHRVQDLPIMAHEVILETQMDKMIEYCWNDVDFTFELARDCWSAVQFRENISKILGKNVMDYSDVKIGEYLNQKKYEELSGLTFRDFRESRTYRKNYLMSDIIPKCVEYKSDFMKDFLEKIKKVVFKDKDVVRYDILLDSKGFHNLKEGGYNPNEIKIKQQELYTILTFAKGGLHTVDMPRLHKRKEGWILKEKDVGSMYPRSIIVDEIYPEHLGVEWNKGIEASYNYRINVLKPKQKEVEYGSNEWQSIEDEQQVYKLAMNGGGFGKLGSAYSWQYDPLAKYKVTIGCELKLLMLIEDFVLNGIEIVSVNTDGVVIHYDKSKEQTVVKIHSEWENKTGFLLEDTFYNKIVFSSVNDYIAVVVDENSDKVVKIKYKGDFEIEKEPHKNNSQRIVPIVLSEFFTKDNIDIKGIIGSIGYEFTNSKGELEKTTIYDYCIGKKRTNSCQYWLVEKGKAHNIPDKVIRFYVSKDTSYLLKKYTKGAREGGFEKVNSGFNITMFMEHFPPSRGNSNHYNIDVYYYLNECLKIIKNIQSGTRILQRGSYRQGSLF